MPTQYVNAMGWIPPTTMKYLETLKSMTDGKDNKELKASLSKIQKTAGDIIASLDKKLEELQVANEKDVAKDEPSVRKPAAAVDESKVVAEKKPLGYIKVNPEKSERPSVLAKLKLEKQKIKLKTMQNNMNKEALINGR